MIAAKLLSLLLAPVVAHQTNTNPIQKVIELLSGLEAKLIKEGEVEQKAYEEFVDWCDSGAKDKQFEVKTAKSEIESLEATISKSTSTSEEMVQKIADLGSAIAKNEADLKDATDIREKEHADFAAAESELMDAVDTLERAISVLEKHAGASFVQTPVDTKHVEAIIKMLNVAIDTAAFSSNDKQKLTSLVQNRADSDDDDSDAELGAPAPDAYKGHSSNIVDVLTDMKDKAEGELAEARKAEMNAQHNYDMLKQSLTDEMTASSNEKKESESTKEEADGTKATAEGDLAQTQKDLAVAQEVLANVHTDCMQKASDHEVSTNGRAAELAALAKAKKIIQQTTAGATSQSYSLFQVSSISSNLRNSADLANFEVVTSIKALASKFHDKGLMQLASKISATMRYKAAAGEDPFAKVKDLITDMIDRLIKEGEAETGHKAYCDSEMSKTKKKKEELMYDVDKLTSKIDVATSRSAKLKAQVSELSKELTDLAELQNGMDKARADGKAAFTAAKADLEQGIQGVQNALGVLREFYQSGGEFLQQPAVPEVHEKSTGAGGNIIAMLEVIESDFSKNLAEEETEEESAQTEYDKLTQENKLTKTTKEQDIKYKTQEATALDKDVAEMKSDREGTQTELDAVMEYDKQIKSQCIAQPESYEERKERREAEIAGLKEALSVLEGAAFMQKGKRGLRGVATRRHL